MVRVRNMRETMNRMVITLGFMLRAHESRMEPKS